MSEFRVYDPNDDSEKVILDVGEITLEDLEKDEEKLFRSLEVILAEEPPGDNDYNIDQIVSACKRHWQINDKVNAHLSNEMVGKPEEEQQRITKMQYFINKRIQ